MRRNAPCTRHWRPTPGCVWKELVSSAHHVAELGRAYAGAVPVIEGRKKDRDKIGLAVARSMLAQVHHRAGSFDKALQEITEALRILPGGRDRLMLRAILYSTKAQCELGLGSVERGLAAARQAADILRSGKLPSAERNLGWDELGELGEELWRSGQDALAVDLLREAIEQLELGGAAATAAQYRIKLSAVLRQLGNLDDAWRWLPNEGHLSVNSRRCLLAEKARSSWRPGVRKRRLPIAGTCSPCGRQRRTIRWSRRPPPKPCWRKPIWMREIIRRRRRSPVGPPRCSVRGSTSKRPVCLITLALAQWRITSEWAPDSLEEAHRVIQADPLLSPAAKKRILDSHAARVERYGPAKEVRAAVAVVAAYS